MEDKNLTKLTTNVGVKGNVRYITITDNVPLHWQDLITIVKSSYTWYAFIYHDKDDTDKHIHILAYDEGGTSLKAHCKRFSSVIPSNFVLKVYNPRAMARYLIHKDNPEKFQYDLKNIETNSKDKLYSFMKELNSDCTSEYQDFKLVRRGLMTVEDFLEKYRGEFSTMPFYQKLNLYSKLENGYYKN